MTPTSGARRALIIANDTYDHASLGQLRAPEADARALAEVLGDPEIGGFEVSTVHNAASYEVQSHIEDLFADSRPDDLLLLHFSGHGLKSDSGELFIAARNTRPDRLASTSVAADFVQRCMRSSRARSIVLFLDCCYGGAFGEGVAVRAAGPVNVMESFPAGRLGGGRGRAVISASSAMEYAFEGTTLASDHQAQPSVFTAAVVEGLRSGDADRDEDGLVSLNELYDYVFDRVHETNPKQTPGRDVEMSGELYLAKSRRRRVRPVPIPEAIAAALREPDPTYRRGAVSELRDRLSHPDLGVALGALEALRSVARSDIKAVSDDASAVIAAAAPVVTPTTLDFGQLSPDADTEVRQELHIGGVPLAREVSVAAEPPLAALVEGSVVTVTFSPTGRPYAAQLTLSSPTGSVVVPVTAGVAPVAENQTESPGETAGEPTGAPAVAGSAALVERRLVPTPAAERPATVPPAPRVEGPAAVDTPAPGRIPDSPASPAHQGLGHRVRVIAGWAAIVAGLLMLASMTVPWLYGATYADDAPQMLPAMLIHGLLAVTAGVVMLAPRVRTEVGLGLLLAVAATAAPAILTFMAAASRHSMDAVEAGWWLGVLGLLLTTVTGIVAVVVVAWRNPLPLQHIDWRDWGTVAVLVLGSVMAILLVSYATYLGSTDNGYGAGTAYLGAVATVGGTIGSVIVRPHAVGRALLAGLAVGSLSYSVADWVYFTDNGQDPHGTPFLVVMGVALACAAMAIGRRRPVGNSSATMGAAS